MFDEKGNKYLDAYNNVIQGEKEIKKKILFLNY